jgi:hypothetical protein
MTPTMKKLAVWLLAPVAILVGAAALGHQMTVRGRGPIYAGTAGRSAAEVQDLESATALAVANAIWAFGDADAVKAMARTEIDRLPASDGPARARVLIRFGTVDSNFDGQAALFGQACVFDPTLCDPASVKRAVETELRARFVPPRVLPSYVVGHPTLGQR